MNREFPRYYVQSSQVRGERRAYWIEDRWDGGYGFRDRTCVVDFGTRKLAAERRCAQMNDALLSEMG